MSNTKATTSTARGRAIKMAEVREITGWCRATVYNQMAAGKFPRQRRIPGTRSVRWCETEVRAWVERLFESGEEQPLAA